MQNSGMREEGGGQCNCCGRDLVIYMMRRRKWNLVDPFVSMFLTTQSITRAQLFWVVCVGVEGPQAQSLPALTFSSSITSAPTAYP